MAEQRVDELVLAGAMVVYGEGSYLCTRHGWCAPWAAAAGSRPGRGRFEPLCPQCGAGLTPGLVCEDAQLDPRNVYAATKLAQEWRRPGPARPGGRAIALRYHNVYGPGMPQNTLYAGVASFFRSALARGQAPRVYEDGGQRRDFVHVSDVASANTIALEALRGMAAGQLRCYNVGSGDPRTIAEMACELAAATQEPARVVTGEYGLGDVRHITASSERIRSELNWLPVICFSHGMAAFAHAPMRPSHDAS